MTLLNVALSFSSPEFLVKLKVLCVLEPDTGPVVQQWCFCLLSLSTPDCQAPSSNPGETEVDRISCEILLVFTLRRPDSP